MENNLDSILTALAVLVAALGALVATRSKASSSTPAATPEPVPVNPAPSPTAHAPNAPKAPTIVQVPSPNFTEGRNGYKVELIVIHIMAGTLAGTDSWFGSPKSKVSTQYGIGKKGEVHQYVGEGDMAWHAGRVSNPSFKLYKPNVNPNWYTIGIEHEGEDLSKDITPEMHAASASMIASIAKRHNIPLDRDHVIGHYQVFDQKPNCPATDKSIIDDLLSTAREIQASQEV